MVVRGGAVRWAAGAVVVVLAVGLASCTDRAELPRGDGPVADVAVSRDPVWRSADLGLKEVIGADLRGDKAIVVGTLARSFEKRLVVVDADTGKPYWFEDLGDGTNVGYHGSVGVSGRPLVVGSGDDWSVLVPQGDGEIVALSGKDGSRQWKAKLPTEDGRLSMLSTDGRRALVGVKSNDSHQVTTYALDADDGRELWRHAGDWVYAFAGGTVLGQRTRDASWTDGDLDVEDSGSVFALDADTGKEQWDLNDRYHRSVLERAVDGSAVIRVQRTSGATDRGIVVGTGTGRKKHVLKKGFQDCASDGRELLACVPLDSHRLLTIRAGHRDQPVRSERTVPCGQVDAVVADRVYVSTSGTKSRAVDRAGNTLEKGFPGKAVAVAGGHAAFLISGEGVGNDRLVVHRVASGDERPTAPETSPGKPRVKPLSYHENPLWATVMAEEGDRTADPARNIEDSGLETLDSIELVGDTVLYSGATDDAEDFRFVAADAATGKRRWWVGSTKGLGGGDVPSRFASYQLAGKNNRLLLVPYGTKDSDDGGVAAISMRDGKVLWKVPVAGDEEPFVAGADEKHFVLGIADGAKTPEKTVVYGVESHREVITRRGMYPAVLVDDTVLAEGRQGAVAFDPASGEQKWRMRGYQDTDVPYAADGVAVVSHRHGSIVVDPATGQRFGRSHLPVDRCDGSGSLVACDGGGFPVTFALRDHTVRELMSLQGLRDFRVSGKRFFATSDGWNGTKEYRAIDALGRRVGATVPGIPAAIDDRYVVLVDGAFVSAARVTVHRRG